LENFLNSQKLKRKFVAVGLPEIAAFNRVLTLPSLSLEELDDAVKWQSEPLLPLPIDQPYLDWMLLEKDQTSVRVLVMALPSQLVEDYAQILEDLGLQPVAFEPTSLSLSRLIDGEGKSSLAIEARENEIVLVVVGPHGEIELTSTVFFKEKDERSEFLETLNHLLIFYAKKAGPKGGVAKVLICGQDANEALKNQIKEKTSLETELISLKPIEFASAISLARKDVAAPIDEKTINLLPPRIQGVYDLAEKSRLLSNWVKFWLFSLFLIFFGFAVAAARVHFDLQRIKGELIELQASITPEVRTFGVQAKTVSNKASRILTFSESQEGIISLLGALQTNLPEGVSLSHLSVDFGKRQILVNGTASHRDRLLTWRESLEKDEKFAQVRIPLSSLEREENVNFTVTLIAK